MPELWLRDIKDTSTERVDSTHPLPVKVINTSDLVSSLTWKQKVVLSGRAFQTTVGTLTTPVTGGGAGTVLDAEQPELRITVPKGTAIMPLRIRVDCQTPLIAADADECEILIAVDATQGAVTGTGTAETPINMRTDAPRASSCVVTSAMTADTVTPTFSMELLHPVITADVQGTPATALWGSLYADYEPATGPWIVGPAMLLVYWGGTVATSGFCSAEWAEFATSEITV